MYIFLQAIWIRMIINMKLYYHYHMIIIINTIDIITAIIIISIIIFDIIIIFIIIIVIIIIRRFYAFIDKQCEAGWLLIGGITLSTGTHDAHKPSFASDWGQKPLSDFWIRPFVIRSLSLSSLLLIPFLTSICHVPFCCYHVHCHYFVVRKTV